MPVAAIMVAPISGGECYGFSREAAKLATPRRKPWDVEPEGEQAAER